MARGESLDEMRAYELVICEAVEEEGFNSRSPVAVRTEVLRAGRCRLLATTDQSGLVGLVRHLHQSGIVISTISRKRRQR